jgi:peptidoglycan hydrolase CwlO-like protein
MQKTFDKGLDTSRDLFQKARERAKDLGEKGVIRFEIMQLQQQVEKLMGQLGSTVYKKFEIDKENSIQYDNVKTILLEIEDVRKKIEEREKKLSAM